MKTIHPTFFLLLLLGCFAGAQAFAQEQIGTTSELKQYLMLKPNQRSEASHKRNLETSDKDLKIHVNYSKTESSGDRIVGDVDNHKGSLVEFQFEQDGSMHGQVIIPDAKKAYDYQSDVAGNVSVKEVDINNFICVGLPPADDEEPIPKGRNAITSIPPASSAVWKLESLPGAEGVIYLDFDGENVPAGTSWNGGKPITALPFNWAETEIRQRWESVSEDFRPFRINVTTDVNKYKAAPIKRRVQCIMTSTTSFYPGVSGVAYSNAFFSGRSTVQPAWVFGKSHNNYRTMSHEIGHTLSLKHDGRIKEGSAGAEGYYGGHGLGVTAWIPIMGSGGRDLSQWSKGEYPRADTKEDDIAIIAGPSVGVGFRPDEAGNTNATAKALVVESDNKVVGAKNAGIIASQADVDVYSFNTTGGSVKLTVGTNLPNAGIRYANLDVELTLTNSSGTVLTTVNPAATTAATINQTLTAGTYYLQIRGGSYLTPATGYSRYGSIGGYEISGTVPSAGGVSPAPTISLLITPSGDAPATVKLAASPVAASGHSISKVEFYNGDTKIAERSTLPYTYDWLQVAAGTYAIMAKVTDSKNETATAYQTVVVEKRNVLPACDLSISGVYYSPPNAIIHLKAPKAVDPDGVIVRVDYYKDGQLLGSGSGSDFHYDWMNLDHGTYQVFARCVDNRGGMAETPIQTAKVGNGGGGSNPAPSITLSTPTVSGTAPATVAMAATATDANGIAKVEFFNGGTLLFSDTSSPYTYSWPNVAAGTYSVTAKATDTKGASTTSAARSVTVSAPTTNNPPTITFNTPTVSGTAPATVAMVATATDADGIAKVEFFNGGTLLSSDTSSPYTYSWPNVAAGTYSITAKATDTKGGMTTSAIRSVIVPSGSGGGGGDCAGIAAWDSKKVYSTPVVEVSYAGKRYRNQHWTQNHRPDQHYGNGKAWALLGDCAPITVNQPPTVALSSATAVAPRTAPATVTMAATATDPDGTVSNVEFFNGSILLYSDTSSPYSYSWTNVPAGTYSITAKARDDKGAVSTLSTARSVTVNAPASNQAPSVSLTSAATVGSTTAPATIRMTATASDPDGTISKVEFFNGSNSTPIYTDTSSPYSYDWVNVPAGTYSITAKATDNKGMVSMLSAARSVTVNAAINQPPTVALTEATALGAAPAIVRMSATASDLDGTISKVEFYNGSSLLFSDTSAPYSYEWANVKAGAYPITAKATDNKGAVSTSVARSVTVDAAANKQPVVTLNNPAVTGTAPATVSLSATASDQDGTISKVEFFNGSTRLFSDSSFPYSYTWTNVAAGTYSLTAKATDNKGAMSTTAAKSVTVSASDGGGDNCQGVATWDSKAIYTGTLYEVSYAGKIYRSQHWTQNQRPDLNNGQGKAWRFLRNCSEGMAATNPPLIVSLSPNPASDNTVTVSVNAVKGRTVTVKVLDAFSMRQYTSITQSPSMDGTISLSLDISSVPKGNALVTVSSGVETDSRVLIRK